MTVLQEAGFFLERVHFVKVVLVVLHGFQVFGRQDVAALFAVEEEDLFFEFGAFGMIQFVLLTSLKKEKDKFEWFVQQLILLNWHKCYVVLIEKKRNAFHIGFGFMDYGNYFN